jgi:hypothetical protein
MYAYPSTWLSRKESHSSIRYEHMYVHQGSIDLLVLTSLARCVPVPPPSWSLPVPDRVS